MMNNDDQLQRLQKLQDEIMKWSDDTFGKYRSASPMAYHLKKESDELIYALKQLEEESYTNSDISAIGVQELIRKNNRILFELADCFSLIIDCAAHAQIKMNRLIDATEEKLQINKERKWGKPDVNGVVEHIET
jgi:NTP pyrophosphatase (non-canonical NTP hydrolase)